MTRINVVNEDNYRDLEFPYLAVYFDGKKVYSGPRDELSIKDFMFELIQYGVLKDTIYQEDELSPAGSEKVDETLTWPDNLEELKEFLP